MAIICGQRYAERYGEGPNFKVDESQAVTEVLHQGSLEALPAFGSLLACLLLAACQIVHFD